MDPVSQSHKCLREASGSVAAILTTHGASDLTNRCLMLYVYQNGVLYFYYYHILEIIYLKH